MNLLRTLVNTAYNFYNPVSPERTPNPQKHSQTFNSDDVPGVWRPLLGYNLFDSVTMRGHYKSFAYACINKKAINFSKAKIYLYRQFKSKKNEIENHPFLNLINSQNQYKQSFREMLFTASCNCDMYGNAYLLINYVQLPFGRLPVSFTPLPAKYMTPMLDSQNEMVEYYYYGSKQVKFSPEEIIRFKIPAPDSNIFACAPVNAFNFTLDIEYLQSRSQRVFFDNSAMPSLIVSTKGKMNEEVKGRFREDFNARHKGVDNRGSVMFAEGETTVDAIGPNQKEMDYVNSRKQILDEIMLILDVSKQVMNIFEDSNYNNSQNALLSWIINTISPYADMIFNEKLTAFVKDNYDKKLVTTMEYDTSNPEFELKEIETFSKEKLASKNELRNLRGWDNDSDPRSDKIWQDEPSPPINEPNPVNQ